MTALTIAAIVIGLAASAASAAPSFRLVRVAQGFVQPTWVGGFRGDPRKRLFVIEQHGRVLVREPGQPTRVFIDITSVVGDGGPEQGLLSMAFHPNMRNNGRFWLYYTNNQGDGRIVEYKSIGGKASARGTVVLGIRLSPPNADNHNGGQLAYGPDNFLYLGVGDGGSGNDPEENAQDLTTLMGKLIRINVHNGLPYTIPASNPYAASNTERREIFALGLRNPWRMSFDRTTRALFIGDVGQSAQEEIDYVANAPANGANTNFGWDQWEGTAQVEPGSPLNPLSPAHTLPITVRTHAQGSCSITGGYMYRGAAIPSLRSFYVFTDLCDSTLRGFQVQGGDNVNNFATAISLSGIASFGEDHAGELYLLTRGGAIWKFLPR